MNPLSASARPNLSSASASAAVPCSTRPTLSAPGTDGSASRYSTSVSAVGGGSGAGGGRAAPVCVSVVTGGVDVAAGWRFVTTSAEPERRHDCGGAQDCDAGAVHRRTDSAQSCLQQRSADAARQLPAALVHERDGLGGRGKRPDRRRSQWPSAQAGSRRRDAVDDERVRQRAILGGAGHHLVGCPSLDDADAALDKIGLAPERNARIARDRSARPSADPCWARRRPAVGACGTSNTTGCTAGAGRSARRMQWTSHPPLQRPPQRLLPRR